MLPIPFVKVYSHCIEESSVDYVDCEISSDDLHLDNVDSIGK